MPCRDRGANGGRASCCSRCSSASPPPRTSPPCRWPRCWVWCSCSGSPKGTAKPDAACCSARVWRGARVGLCLLRLLARRLQLCLPLRRRISVVLARSGPAFFSTLRNAGITHCRGQRSALLYLGVRRSRYFGNTAPLLCFLVLVGAGHDRRPGSPGSGRCRFCSPSLAESSPTRYEVAARTVLLVAAAGSSSLLQAILCILSLPGLI